MILFFIDWGQHQLLQLSLPVLREGKAAATGGLCNLDEGPGAGEAGAAARGAQQEVKAVLDPGRIYTILQVGDQAMLRAKELLDAAEVAKLRQ